MNPFNYMDCVEKSTLQALSTGIMSHVLLKQTPYVGVPIINRNIPVWLFGGAVGFVASHINDAVHSFVKSEVHIREKAMDEASMIIGALVGGLTFVGVMSIIDTGYVKGFGLYNALGVGASGEIIGSFAFNLLRG